MKIYFKSILFKVLDNLHLCKYHLGKNPESSHLLKEKAIYEIIFKEFWKRRNQETEVKK